MTDSQGSLIGLAMACVAIGIAALIALWDSYCLVYADRVDWTVSYYLSSWARQFPILILALGIVIGHILWPIGPSHRQ